MSDINILTTDTNAQRQTKINTAVGGDNVIFAVGTHIWQNGEFNQLIGSASGGSVITYKPAGANVVLKKIDPNGKTEPIFTDNLNDGSATVHHNVLFDGTVGGVADMTFDGGGIQIVKSWHQDHTNWEIKFCKMKNFWTGANGNGGYGAWWLNTISMPGLKIHHNVASNSIATNKEGYWLFVHVYDNMDDVKIHHNTCTDVYQFANITAHSTIPANAPTGFEVHHNTIAGVSRMMIEFLGIPCFLLNPMFYFNTASGWKSTTSPSPVALSAFGISLVCDGAYGAQCFGNVINGGRVFMPSANTIPRIALEEAGYYSYDFANLLTGFIDGWHNTGGSQAYCYGNTFATNDHDTVVKVGNNGLPVVFPVYDTSRAADSGTDATATVTVAGGKVTALTITDAGTNYKHQFDAAVGDAVVPPRVTISGDGTGAKVYAWVDPSNFHLGGFIIMNGGSGYTSATATITRTAGSVPNTHAGSGNNDYPLESGGTAPTPPTIAKPNPTDGNFLSDFATEWIHSPETVNSLGPIELDKSNGTIAANDGTTLSIGGNPIYTYLKGIGCFAPCLIAVDLTGKQAIRFKAEVGIDNEVASGLGSVVFQVLKNSTNAVPTFETPQMVAGNQPREIDIDLTGWTKLYLNVLSLGSNTNDSAAWAHARIVVSTSPVTKQVTCVNVDLANHLLTKLYNDNSKATEETI